MPAYFNPADFVKIGIISIIAIYIINRGLTAVGLPQYRA